MKNGYSPYGSFSLEKIEAPKKEKKSPKSSVKKGKGDLRDKGSK
jgi:hypothetical protein